MSYYRERINGFDLERKEWLEKLEELRYKQQEKHKSEWELKKRKNEIAELQKSLCDLKVALFEERKWVLKLTRENDALKIN